MPWYYAVAERDHEIQNPTNAEKIALLGNYLRLTPDSRVIDLACGKGGPAILLASTFGCSVLGIERAPEFVEAAQDRIAAAGVGDLVEVLEADAHAYPLEPATWDAANPRDPDATEIRQRHEQARDDFLSFQRELMGWAIFAARRRS